MPDGPRGTTSPCRFCCRASAERQNVIDRLREAGIQTTIHYPPTHRLSFYRDLYPNVSLPKTEDFAARELTLPLHPRMEAADVETVTRCLAEALEAEPGFAGAASFSEPPCRFFIELVREGVVMIVTTSSEDEGLGTAAERARRALDICLICMAVLFLGPLLLLVAAAVWLESGGPILFCQVRIGKGGADTSACTSSENFKPRRGERGQPSDAQEGSSAHVCRKHSRGYEARRVTSALERAERRHVDQWATSRKPSLR